MILFIETFSKVMPYKDPDAHREASKLAMRKYRAESEVRDDAWLAKEKARKAAWYAENKEKKAEAQRKYRARKKLERENL